jgi:Protein of unknown function (DUF669)
MAKLIFDARLVKLIPAGEYHVQIIRSEMSDTTSSGEKYLWLELSIMDGPHAYIWLFDALNIVNTNKDAADIGREKLAAICRATGQMSVSDSEQLHNRSMIANVQVQHGSGVIGPWNTVAQYLPYTAIAAE